MWRWLRQVGSNDVIFRAEMVREWYVYLNNVMKSLRLYQSCMK